MTMENHRRKTDYSFLFLKFQTLVLHQIVNKSIVEDINLSTKKKVGEDLGNTLSNITLLSNKTNIMEGGLNLIVSTCKILVQHSTTIIITNLWIKPLKKTHSINRKLLAQ